MGFGKVKGPFTIAIPLSTIEHWRRELAGWTVMNFTVYHDSEREWRDAIREYKWYYADRPRNSDFLKVTVMVTTRRTTL
jgi:SNF2 family DNA or RNA helicase